MREINHNNRRGMSLFESMIVVGILSVCGMIGAFGIRACLSGDVVEQDAVTEVMKYTTNLGVTIDKTPQGRPAISCGNIGTKKGLVGCTYKSGGVTHQLECIGRYSVGHGCRDQKLSIPQQGEDAP